MRLPSIDRAVKGARRALRRFPLVIASALVTATAGMVLLEGGNESPWIRVGAAASLGLPLFTALTLLARRRGLPEAGAWGLRALGVLVLAAFYWRWPSWSSETMAIRYFHLSAGFHFLVAVIAYVGVAESNGFWQFNRALLLRFLTGVLYSIALFAGLAVALLGIDNLLGVDVREEVYGRLWMAIAFVFNTWFFAAGVPVDFEDLDRLEEYPGGLRAFSQYVLLPLVTIYLLILTSYLVRVLVTREWPSGWIGYLVSALAVLGILSLLLIHPLREREGHGWIDRYARSFWIAIIPSVIMLLLAIWQRIDQYGITEPRYLLSILALWLTAVAAYFAVSRSRNIKIIPGSLAALAFLSFIGPWSAYSTALRSQIGRLSGALERYGVLVDGSITPTTADLPETERREITGALRYVIQYHGTGPIDDWFPDGVAAIDTIGEGTLPSNAFMSLQRATILMRYMGIEPVDVPSSVPEDFRYYTAVYPRPPLDIAGFDWAFTGVSLQGFSATVGLDSLALSFGVDDLVLRLDRNGDEVIARSLAPFLERISRNLDVPGGLAVPTDSLRIDAEEAGYVIRVYVTQLTVDVRTDPPTIAGATGDVFLRSIAPIDDDEPDPTDP
ncbi:MAG: DUF4153 domain-containing protein [Gemmatimonadota bacterium]